MLSSVIYLVLFVVFTFCACGVDMYATRKGISPYSKYGILFIVFGMLSVLSIISSCVSITKHARNNELKEKYQSIVSVSDKCK